MIDLVKFGDGLKIPAADLVANPLGSLKVVGFPAFSHNPLLIGWYSVQIQCGSIIGDYDCKAKIRKHGPDCIKANPVGFSNMLFYIKSALNRCPFRCLKINP